MTSGSDILTLAIDRLPYDARLGVTSAGMERLVHLTHFFGGRPIARIGQGRADAVIGWGAKRSGRVAWREAARRGVPAVVIEDGFIRSVGLGKSGAPPVSIVVDDRGIYFDAAQPSRLEMLLASSSAWLDEPLRRQAEAGLERWKAERLSKYTLGREAQRGDRSARRIILMDQVRGDASIPGALASATTFTAMLADARATYSDDQLAIRVHPDVAAGKARGYLAGLAAQSGIELIADDLSPAAVLDRAEAVWTVSSGIGAEALLRGIPVVTFGVPFYAGFGLTEDRAAGTDAIAALARRGQTLRPSDVFAAAFLVYARYADPVRCVPLDFDGACDRLIDWRRRAGELAAGKTYAFGFSRWKQAGARGFIGAPFAPVVFGGKARLRGVAKVAAARAERVAVWGITDPPGFETMARHGGRAFVRVEDGFVRSVGLGSDIRPAGSLVLDDLGIYYDASRASRLEALIAEGPFSADLLARARLLRERLVANATTKYNLGGAPDAVFPEVGGRRVMLVAEQVPGDAALRLGTGRIATNAALLAAVREARPDAFIVYKEHPDLVAGNRGGRLPRAALLAHADAIISAGDMGPLYDRVDELHVMSSLAGFEALLRGGRVVVWGKPFYAGWGLTDDHEALPRRQRRATLDELVAATLILYPRYAEPLFGVPCSAEEFLDCLDRIRARGGMTPAPGGVLRFVARHFGRLKRKVLA